MQNHLGACAQDVRLAFRTFRKNPLFAVSALLTLGLGIGANAAIFTLLDDLLLRPLPVPEPDRLVQVVLRGEQTGTAFSYPALTAIQQRTTTLAGLFTWNSTNFSLGWGVDARRINGAVGSGAVYETLGIRAQAGRLFGPADDSAAATPVAVLSDRFWNTEFHRDPAAIGRKITLDRHTFTIIGVTPREFHGLFAGSALDVTVPFHANAALHPKWNMEHATRIWWLSLIARLQPAVSMAQADAEMRVLSPEVLKAIDPTTTSADQKEFIQQKLGVRPGGRGDSWQAQRYQKPLFVLIAVSGLVLLIACVNLASLMMARAAQRAKEMAVRLALGAGRARLVRQLLTEAVLLSLAGAVLGGTLAAWVISLVPKFLPLAFDSRPDARVLCYLAGLALTTAILFGVAPAMRGTDLSAHHALKRGRIGSDSARWSLGRALASLQVALSVVLLLGALLFARTLKNLKSQDTGLNPQNLIAISTNSERSGMSGEQLARFYDGLLSRIRALPAVHSAALAAVLPLTGNYVYEELERERWPNLSESERTVYINRVAPEYFKTTRMPLLAGRNFEERDDAGPDKVAVLSAAAAATYFGGRTAVGQLLALDEKDVYRVIGVVADAKYASLRDPAPRTIFFPAMQRRSMSPNPMMAGTTWHIIVRAVTDSSGVVSAVRSFVRGTGKDVVIEQALPFDQMIDDSLSTERTLAVLAAFFAALAAALAAIGLYGVLAYTIARRTSEIGLRIALGATSQEVLWMVLRQALLLAGAGVIAGVAAGAACARLISSLLFQVRPGDPTAIMAAALLMLLLAAVAAFVPARRASRLEPLAALRCE